ncbi:MAG: hypothetical protein ABIT20_06660, partial [Gemmatimonadaceae bacterium]
RRQGSLRHRLGLRHRRLHEVPVGFAWFADGLLDGSLGFGGEGELGEPVYDRVEAPATPAPRALLAVPSAQQVNITGLAGEKIDNVLA